jgi:hypothetical protein
MRHEMLTQRALFCIAVMAKRVTLSQHFVTACRTSSDYHLRILVCPAPMFTPVFT